MSQIITLRHKKEGESCIDLKVLEALIDHVTGTWDYPTVDHQESKEREDATLSPEPTQQSNAAADSSDPSQNTTANVDNINTEPPQRTPFLIRALTTLTDTQIAPLASSGPLLTLLSRLSLWRYRPAESLSLLEKAWRATTNSPTSTPKDLVGATNVLVNGYRTLGPMERERTGGEVEKAWRFKARSAVRSVMGKAKGTWDDSEEYKTLEGIMEGLKNDKTE